MNNSKRILAALLAGAMVLCAGCGKEEETEEESSNSTAVEVTDVTSGAMSSEYTLNGKIAAVNEVQVFPLLAGQVQTLNVSEGDTVSKGQTLFTVDTSTVTSTMVRCSNPTALPRPRPTARSNPRRSVWSRRSLPSATPRRCLKRVRLPSRI